MITQAPPPPMIFGTFSIVAYHAPSQAWGVAVTSRIPTVGAIVPFARADAGAVASQSLPDINAGPLGLSLMADGTAAADALVQMLSVASAPQAVLTAMQDQNRDITDLRTIRQIGVVDAQGRAAAYTGADCLPWAGDIQGDGFTTQGNILTGEAVLQAVAENYTASADNPDFADRLIDALAAGYDAGGDSRTDSPFNSAALLIARHHTGYYGVTDRFIDLRTDNHPAPITDLRQLREAHRVLEVDL